MFCRCSFSHNVRHKKVFLWVNARRFGLNDALQPKTTRISSTQRKIVYVSLLFAIYVGTWARWFMLSIHTSIYERKKYLRRMLTELYPFVLGISSFIDDLSNTIIPLYSQTRFIFMLGFNLLTDTGERKIRWQSVMELETVNESVRLTSHFIECECTWRSADEDGRVGNKITHKFPLLDSFIVFADKASSN